MKEFIELLEGSNPISLILKTLVVLLAATRWILSSNNTTNSSADIELTSAACFHINRYPSPTRDTLLDIDMVSADEGWAVGENGTILHFHDGKWFKESFQTQSTLSSVSADRMGNIWIVGNQPQIIIRFYENKWAIHESPIKFLGLYDISSWGEDQGIIVGGQLGLNNRVAIIGISTNGDFSRLASAIQNFSLISVSFQENGEGWAVGSGTFLHFNEGMKFSNSPITLAGEYNALQINASTGWAVGNRGITAKLINGQWSSGPKLGLEIDLLDVDLVSDDEIWIVGTNELILGRIGNEWKMYSYKPQFLGYSSSIYTSIDMISTREGWVVGSDGKILKIENNCSG